MFISFEQHIKVLYKTGDCAAKRFPSLRSFRQYYIHNVGFNDWLRLNQGQMLTMPETIVLAKEVVQYGKRTPAMLPGVLAQFSRQYQFTYPKIRGLFAQNFWAFLQPDLMA